MAYWQNDVDWKETRSDEDDEMSLSQGQGDAHLNTSEWFSTMKVM